MDKIIRCPEHSMSILAIHGCEKDGQDHFCRSCGGHACPNLPCDVKDIICADCQAKKDGKVAGYSGA